MNKPRLKILTIIFVLCFALAGCTQSKISDKLLLTGDVDNCIEISEIYSDIEMQNFKFKGKTKSGVPLESLIEKAGALKNFYDVYLNAYDGFMVKLDADTIADTFICYSKENGFHYLSNKHPVNSRIKNIDEIIVRQKYSENEVPKNGIHIIGDDYDVHKSIGELLTTEYKVLSYLDGTSRLDDVAIDVMKQKRVVELSSLVDEKINNVLLMDAEGNHEYIYTDDGYLEIDSNRINFFTDDASSYYRDIEGIIINPPNTSVMNAFYDSQHYLQTGDKVLLVFIDGFSYSQYEYVSENNPDLFLCSIDGVKKATTVFKPVTNAGFAAMITGVSPKQNGILNRDYREVQVDTIFDIADAMGESALLVEGDIKILNTQSQLKLNMDNNGDGYTDDEVFTSAVKNINEGYDFALVHFHGVDDAGHDYGPFGEQTLQRINIIDKYTKELVDMWDGKVIIAVDHGMHKTKDGGDHGEFRYEDMFVPYVIINGGEYEK